MPDVEEATLCDAFEKMATNRQNEVSFERAHRSAHLMCLHHRHAELIEITKNWLIAAACYCLTSRATNTVLLDRSRYDEVCKMFRDVLMFYNSCRPRIVQNSMQWWTLRGVMLSSGCRGAFFGSDDKFRTRHTHT